MKIVMGKDIHSINQDHNNAYKMNEQVEKEISCRLQIYFTKHLSGRCSLNGAHEQCRALSGHQQEYKCWKEQTVVQRP